MGFSRLGGPKMADRCPVAMLKLPEGGQQLGGKPAQIGVTGPHRQHYVARAGFGGYRRADGRLGLAEDACGLAGR